MTEQTEYAIDATDTSLEILEQLVENGPRGVTAIASELDMAKSAVHNHLTTLRARGYVVNRDGTYEASLGLLELGNRARGNLDLYDVRAKIDNLAEATGETTILATEEAGHAVAVYIATTPDSWRPPFYEGERLPLHSNAAGKAILSTFSRARVEDMLTSNDLTAPTDRTVTDTDELTDQISRIRDDGIAFSKEEQFDGIVGVAAPLPQTNDVRPAAISVAGSADTLHGRHFEEDVTGQVVSTTKAINVELTGE